MIEYDPDNPQAIRAIISSGVVARVLANAGEDGSGVRLRMDQIGSRAGLGQDEKTRRIITNVLHIMRILGEADYVINDQGEQVWWLSTMPDQTPKRGPKPRSRRRLGGPQVH